DKFLENRKTIPQNNSSRNHLTEIIEISSDEDPEIIEISSDEAPEITSNEKLIFEKN
ncbi:15376_t:CDS:1, partial [Racocetra fulgida]